MLTSLVDPNRLRWIVVELLPVLDARLRERIVGRKR